MTHLVRFDDLQAVLRQGIALLPDHRKASPNTRYTIQEAVLSAFGVFFTQSPSFLEYQRRLQHTKGQNNGCVPPFTHVVAQAFEGLAL